MIEIEMRQSQLQVEKNKRGRTSCTWSTSISKALEAEGVLVVVLGKEEGFVMPWWTRRM
jgi:hypothetical protein